MLGGASASDSVTVKIIKVQFDKTLVKTGFSLLPSVTIKADLKATVTPKEKVNDIIFDTDNPARATVSVVSRNAVTGVVNLEVKGVSATPSTKPSGDTVVRAKIDSKILATAKVVVVVPKTQTHTVGTKTLTNTATLVAGGTELKTKVGAIVTITIKDQFGNVLDAVYNGTSVVTEEFSAKTGFFTSFPAGEITIVVPDNKFTNGGKLDETAIEPAVTITVALTAAQRAAWAAGTLEINGAKNVFKLATLTVDGTAVQKIRVHGHVVTPDFKRTMKAEPNNQPPIPYTITDVAQP